MSEALRFNTPEEEIAYLRSRMEQYGDRVTPQAIREVHAELPVVVRESREVKETLSQVADLGSEEKLQEMINITRLKGVFHALSVVEKLENWKREDDFHDYLVELVRGGATPKGAEKGPLYRALNMTLFEVVMPQGNDADKQRELRTIISSMETFYSGMISIEGEKGGRNYFVLEIANENGREDYSFFVSVPNERRSLFEKHLRSVFPTVDLRERLHDYNIFAECSPTAAAVGKLAGSPALPLRTYESFDHDPLNAVLASFTKIPKDGAGASLQIVFSPKSDIYTKKYQGFAKKIEKGAKPKDVLKETSLVGEFVHEFASVFSSSKKKKDEPEPVDTDALDRIKKKLESPIVETNIRIAVAAPNEMEAKGILEDIKSAFNQFEMPGVNKIAWVGAKGAEFYRNFSFRLFNDKEIMPLNLRELTSIIHFHTTALASTAQLKEAKAGEAQAPLDLPQRGTLLGKNAYQGRERDVYITAEDRLRHLYVIGQTGTGKSTLLKNIIIQDIKAGEGVCMIDPHGQDVADVLSAVPPERMQDVIYFDPAATERPLALNMLEYDASRPEEKTFVVNELFSIFQKLYGAVPESMGPMFEQYFRNATMLVIEDPSSGSTLLDVSRVMSNKEYRNLKLSRCRNPVVIQFWREVAEKAGGEAALANIVPYVTSKFDVFLANDIMRPIVAQEHSSFNFREIMDGKKILLVNLSKGRLGDINANLIGLILVGKILMSALSRGSSATPFPPFYLHIDEFQNITTNSIATILSEARKYKLSLTVAHQFIAQLDESIKNAVFGNVGSFVSFRVGADDAEYLEKQFAPIFSAKDLMNVDNFHAYVKMLVNGRPEKAFSLETMPSPVGNRQNIDSLAEMTKLKYGRNREEVEKEILAKYNPPQTTV